MDKGRLHPPPPISPQHPRLAVSVNSSAPDPPLKESSLYSRADRAKVQKTMKTHDGMAGWVYKMPRRVRWGLEISGKLDVA